MGSCCNEQKVVVSDKAPKAIGPYSVGVIAGDLVYSSGQIGLDPTSNLLVGGGIEAETRQALNNLKNVLEAAGSGMEKVVKTTVYLKDMADFARMNAIYGEFFTKDHPARTTISVAALPKGAAVEIEAIAKVDDDPEHKDNCCCKD